MKISKKRYDNIYNLIYFMYRLLQDNEIIDNWKYHQHLIAKRDDYNWIAVDVCEDLLRQRENLYLDNLYPKN